MVLRFDPPLVPKDFVPHHKFAGPLETDQKVPDAAPPEVSPPEDNNLKLLIDGVATLVARCGKLFEDLSREKNQSNPMFNFLLGGNGHDYYMRKLWEARQKRADQKKDQLDGKASPSMQKLTAESRGKILGERALERHSNNASPSVASSNSIHLQYNLSDTFIKPASLVSPIHLSSSDAYILGFHNCLNFYSHSFVMLCIGCLRILLKVLMCISILIIVLRAERTARSCETLRRRSCKTRKI